MIMEAAHAKKIMTDAHNRIVHFHNERDQVAAARRPKNFVLYPYTTAEGLKGIVENDELWVTSAYYLNDSTEIMYGYQLIDEALAAWKKILNPPEDTMAGGLVCTLQRQFVSTSLPQSFVLSLHCSTGDHRPAKCAADTATCKKLILIRADALGIWEP